jgi:arylsulfatase A-like enzyme
MSNLQNSSYGTIKQTTNFDEETVDPLQNELDEFLKQSRTQNVDGNYFKLSFYGCIVVFFLVFSYLMNISTKVFVNNSNASATQNLMSSSGKLQPNSATTTTTTKPNFILIVADDLAWNSIGYTSSEMSAVTEQITHLASKGIIMNNFYAQEVCSPSRGSLMTGRYPLTIGMQYGMVGSVAEWGMPLDEITIGEVLKENGYTTHMLGKWHLGYFSPLFLPTARGFDSWIGYANGENYYWSKKLPDYPKNSDFITSNTSCYKPYDGDDKHDYSTTFYTSKAISIIQEHSYETPLFLYLAYQAVHDPFIDFGIYENGMPDSYIDDNILKSIHLNITGRLRQEYAKSLYMLDKSVGELYDALVEKDVMDNTYIIFMSDNGGCFYGGGKNSPLRGSKGTLFEGGIKVDSFIYSPKLANPGTTYDGLMHISDWFPTIMELANIDYSSDDDNALDGVSQISGWTGVSTPRSDMLYNMYTHLTDIEFDIWTNGSFAVRDSRYKLMHTYDDKTYGTWDDIDQTTSDDDNLDSENGCAQQFITGTFEYWLFDLNADPYETKNIYNSPNIQHVNAKNKLYDLLPDYLENAKTKMSISFSERSKKVWEENDNEVIPWANVDDLENGDTYTYPTLC